jgi:hypothetical protein
MAACAGIALREAQGLEQAKRVETAPATFPESFRGCSSLLSPFDRLRAIRIASLRSDICSDLFLAAGHEQAKRVEWLTGRENGAASG